MTTPRGTTILEVLLASAVLVLGLTGLTQLVIYGMNSSRVAAVHTGAQLQSAASVAEQMMTPYASLTDGTFDGGTSLDVDGRLYSRTIIIAPAGDGGARAHSIEVRTTWTDAVGATRLAISTGLVSEKPDENF
jgi:Tfp pilus assembly protein PilV